MTKIDPWGNTLVDRVLTADQLYLGAGSIGTSELLVRARHTGALPDLNEHVGQGWGGNGDGFSNWSPSIPQFHPVPQAAPNAHLILDEANAPLCAESWFTPGATSDVGAAASLVMVLDSARSEFTYNAADNSVGLTWPATNNSNIVAAINDLDRRVVDRTAGRVSVGKVNELPTFTAHPLGGAVYGKATDNYGRVDGYRGLYVMDGAGIPGSTATANPSLTITAFAERNIERIIRDGG